MKTFTLSTDQETLSSSEILWMYNGLDNIITHHVWEKLCPLIQANPEAQISYNFVRAMRAPALEMMMRGFKIDKDKLIQKLNTLYTNEQRLQDILNKYAYTIWDKPLNPASPPQLKSFLYSKSGLNLPEQFKYDKGKKRISTDADTLENLCIYRTACPILKVILRIKEVKKQISVLNTKIDPDGRIRCSYNVVGTETGRWSSSENAFGTGTNLQNITDALRDICVADEGMKLAYCDLDGAESKGVAYISGDAAYINVCETGDPHTMVTKLIWPELPWGNDLKTDKQIAKYPFYKDYSYRDMSKRGGHGSNYYGKPYTIAKHLKIAKHIVEAFQKKYFTKFKGILDWQLRTKTQLESQGFITTALKRKRIFFDRLNTDETLREAIAFEPQSTIAEILNLALYRVWKKSITNPPSSPFSKIQILGQVHDAILFQFPEALENELIPQVLKEMEIPVSYPSGTMVIKSSAETGWNWRKYNKEENPNGIKKFTGHDERSRIPTPKVSFLDQRLY